MKNLIALYRFVCLILITFIWFILAIILEPILPKKYMAYMVKLWAKTTLYSAGINVKIVGGSGNYIQSNCMVIANHISWLDIPVIYSLYYVSFVARAEIQKWPVFSILMRCVNTIFINRSRKKDILNVNQILGKKLAEGGVIGLFPEGKTSEGIKVEPFKSPLLETAIIANSQIIPLVIEYCTTDNKRTTKITYAGKISLFESVKNTLLLNKVQVKIHVLPKVDANMFDKRNGLSEFLHSQINNYYSLGNINVSTNLESKN